jgi:hypothetical protein
MFHPHYLAHGFDKTLPAPALSREGLTTFGRQLVITPAQLIRLLYPQSLDKASLQAGTEADRSGDVKAQGSCRSCFDQSAELIAVASLLLQQRQNQQFRATLFPH